MNGSSLGDLVASLLRQIEVDEPHILGSPPLIVAESTSLEMLKQESWHAGYKLGSKQAMGREARDIWSKE